MSVTSENYVFVHEEGRSDDVKLSGVYHPEDRTLTYRLGDSTRRYRRDIACLVDDFERLSTGSNSLLAPPAIPISRNGEPSISEPAAMYSDMLYNQMKLKRELAELGVDGDQAVQTFDAYTTFF
ncbi:predicted protein [Botrytis cinerea T4]|uniref:Uncharacterized protein n=1 Tax=Botryotinia fuckeliana (strain T4) TaxID=999810 RepID=G2XP54_BOTF4|nr:predicted protein [Botrytis cinerea T4]